MLMYMCMAGPLHSSFQSDVGHLGAAGHHIDVADGVEQHQPSTECSYDYASGQRALLCYIIRVESGRYYAILCDGERALVCSIMRVERGH